MQRRSLTSPAAGDSTQTRMLSERSYLFVRTILAVSAVSAVSAMTRVHPAGGAASRRLTTLRRHVAVATVLLPPHEGKRRKWRHQMGRDPGPEHRRYSLSAHRLYQPQPARNLHRAILYRYFQDM